jgi:hypothetical protein
MRNHVDRKLYVATQMLGVMGIIPGGPSLGYSPYELSRLIHTVSYIKAAVEVSDCVTVLPPQLSLTIHFLSTLELPIDKPL